MKVNFALGSSAILILMNACGGHPADDPSRSPIDATGGSGSNSQGATGGSGSNSQGATGGSTNDGNVNAAGSKSDGDGDAGLPKSNGAAGTSGSKGNGDGNVAGAKNGNTGTSKSGGDDNAAGATSNGDDNAAGANGDGDDNAGGADSDGDARGGSGGLSNSGGSGGLSNSGGSGGLSNSGGSGGLSSSAGSAGLSGGGGSGGISSSGGSAGLSGGGDSGGLPSSGGSSGVSGSGGSDGLPTGGGSGGASGGGGSGGSAGGGGDSSLDPQYLFTTEQFGGNGRTCITCHSAETGTISPDTAQALYSANPNDPLFQSIDSDDGVGDDYTQLQQHATFRITINLPAGVTLTSDPGATSVTVRRGAPTTINTPALDTVLMWDGREPSLTSQALDAILGHAQATVTPTSAQLEAIAGYEQSYDFFSDDVLRQYAQGGPAPTWPPGGTDSEQRGRRWFAQDSAAPRFNVCGQCHGGPMANTTQSNSGLPVGQRFQTVNVSEFNTLGNPTYEFSFPDPKNPGKTVTVTTPDPGRALITGNFRDVNFFKIPPLWGVKNTAPYFHDNSAATLDELLDHYEKHLATFLPKTGTYPTPHVPTAQDKADIIAYLQLL